MEKSENPKESGWKKEKDWKNRYSKLYGKPKPQTPASENENEEPWHRISFMTNENTPYTSMLMRVRANRRDTSTSASPRFLTSILSQQSDLYGSYTGTGSMLASSEACVHGLSMRMTDRSISRSRVSRLSTRRDMDIPSILAYTTTTTPSVHLGIPAFTKFNAPQQEEIPRWSIRRAVCPVCSQKWRDKSSISNIKYSGLKRNSSSELPSVIAPARLRTAITLGYVPRPVVAAMDREAGVTLGGLRSSSATWQLTRARRFRTPKPQLPPPEATAPPTAAAPLAQRDLDLRVTRFLTDMAVKS